MSSDNLLSECNPDLNSAGLAYYQQGDYQQAIVDYTKVIELAPSFAEAYVVRGMIHHKLGNYTAALSDYKKVLALDQKNLPAITNIGLIKYEQGSIDEAIRQWQQAVNLNPDFAEPKLALAVAFYVKGEQEKAFQMVSVTKFSPPFSNKPLSCIPGSEVDILDAA